MWLSTRLIVTVKFEIIKWEYTPTALKDQRSFRLTYNVLILFKQANEFRYLFWK